MIGNSACLPHYPTGDKFWILKAHFSGETLCVSTRMKAPPTFVPGHRREPATLPPLSFIASRATGPIHSATEAVVVFSIPGLHCSYEIRSKALIDQFISLHLILQITRAIL